MYYLQNDFIRYTRVLNFCTTVKTENAVQKYNLAGLKKLLAGARYEREFKGS